MNIAYFSHYFSPEIGAPSARIHDLSRTWLEDGHSVDVVTCFPNHPEGKMYPGYKLNLYSHEKIDGINVHRNWSYITPNRGIIKKTLGHISFWLSSLLNTTKQLGNLDVVIGTSPTLFAASRNANTGTEIFFANLKPKKSPTKNTAKLAIPEATLISYNAFLISVVEKLSIISPFIRGVSNDDLLIIKSLFEFPFISTKVESGKVTIAFLSSSKLTLSLSQIVSV
jgi:hypothetical protein